MKNKLDFEINLLPVISFLAVCISFLLLSAVWVQIGSTDISQAIGSEAQQSKELPTLWVEFSDSGKSLQITLKNVRKAPKNLRKYSLRILKNGKINWKNFNRHTAKVKQNIPGIKTAMILPKNASSYDNIIKVIDSFKKLEITEVGVAPL